MNDLIKLGLGKAHKILGNSSIGTKLALKIKNQADAVIRARMSDGIEGASNGELKMIGRVAPAASVFIDVGANTGSWALRFLCRMNHRGRGLLFEPSSVAAAILRRNVSAAGHTDSVEIIESAVGDIAGTSRFQMEPDAGETSSMLVEHSRPDARTVEVGVTTIDRAIGDRGIEFVDLLKIDAEGFDLRVIKGAVTTLTRQAIGIIQFEYNQPWALAGNTLADALTTLRGHGYCVYLLKSEGLYSYSYRPYGEYLRIFKFHRGMPERWPSHGSWVVGRA